MYTLAALFYVYKLCRYVDTLSYLFIYNGLCVCVPLSMSTLVQNNNNNTTT